MTRRLRINGDLIWALAFTAFTLLTVASYAAIAFQPRQPTPHRDAIFSCLERSGMPVYAVGKDGPPKPGQVLTAEMIAIICVEEK